MDLANNRSDTERSKMSRVLSEGKNKPLLILVGIFLASAGLLATVYYNFPKLEPHERQHVKLPKCLEDAKQLGLVLDRYKENHYYAVLGGVVVTYCFLQSFAIPGSIFLSILSGYLFSFPVAILLVCFIGKHREHLLNYMLFLRITPFIPNWFINLASPVIDVPLSPFFWGTFLGVAPPSCFFIHTGTTLNTLTKAAATFSWKSMVILGALALLSLVPVIFKKKLREKVE